MKAEADILKGRVQDRLRDLNMTVAEATRRGQLPKDFIYDLLNDRKKSVRYDSLRKLALALDCDVDYLAGVQGHVSELDNIVDFDRPPVYIVGEAAVGAFLDQEALSGRHQGIDMPTLPPDTRFDALQQVDLYVRGNSINRFAPSGFLLRCLLIDAWDEIIREGDMLIMDRLRDGLIERAAWRVTSLTIDGFEFSTDTTDRKEQASWRAPIDGIRKDSDCRPYAMVLFAYAMPRIRRMF